MRYLKVFEKFALKNLIQQQNLMSLMFSQNFAGVTLIVSSSFKFNIFKITCLLELNKPFFITYKLLPDII